MKLYQIVDLLRRRIDTKDVLFNGNCPENIDGKLKELYEGFANDAFKSDDEAAQALFGKGADYPYYFEVKAKLRDQLLKNLFHLNLNSGKFHVYYKQELGDITSSSNLRNALVLVDDGDDVVDSVGWGKKSNFELDGGPGDGVEIDPDNDNYAPPAGPWYVDARVRFFFATMAASSSPIAISRTASSVARAAVKTSSIAS